MLTSQITKIIRYAAFVLVLLVGALLRIGPHIDYSHLADGNVSSYYFDKFNRLVASGRLPEKDIWEFAPGDHPENVPPGLSYISLLFYRVVTTFIPSVDTATFANFFPPFVFVLFGLSASFLFSLRERNSLAGFLVLIVMAFSRIFASYTEYAYYVQESLGVPFLFFSIYFVSRIGLSRADFAGAIASITLLILTWQQFPIFYVGAGVLFLTAIVLREARIAMRLAGALVVPMLLAEAVVRLFVGIEYSAFAMIREFLLGAWLFAVRNPDFLAVMPNKPDWFGTSFAIFLKWYGPFTLALLVLGIFVAVARLRDFRYRAIGLFGVLGVLMLAQFQKEKTLALAAFLLPVAVVSELLFGTEPIVSWQSMMQWRLFRTVAALKKQAVAFIAAAALIAIAGHAAYARLPKEWPVPEVTLDTSARTDGSIDVYLRLTNRGGATFLPSPTRPLWNLNTGLHLEVENADIIEFDANSSLADYEWYYHHIYRYMRLGDFQFLETRYRQLKKDQSGDARLLIKPTGEGPVRVYYRGWLTENKCARTWEDEKLAGRTSADSHSLEKCIVRFPAKGDANYAECPVDVASFRTPEERGYGAYGLKHLTCAVKEL